MEMKKADLMNLCKRYLWLVSDSGDLGDILDFVIELLYLEADSMKETCPWATRGIEAYEAAARLLSSASNDLLDLYESEEA